MSTIDLYVRERVPSATACLKMVLTFAVIGLAIYSLLPLIGY